MKKVFGIDLGTTYSCIAYMDEYGKPVVLRNKEGENTTPSVVLVENEDSIIVGTEAKRSIDIESEKTIQFIKRKMGKDDDTVRINGTAYSAPEISGYILKKIVADANDQLRQTGVIQEEEEIRDVVITCPAYFGLNERKATQTAGELAGLQVLNIINEPTAAAISYGISGKEREETALVYDLGGGTFDITMMKINKGNITVICTGGDDHLGGKDWDDCLVEYVMERYQEEFGEDLSGDPDILAALYVDAETWKKALSVREKINITVNGPAGRFREELTREKYDQLTEKLLNRTKNLLNDMLHTFSDKGYSIDDIDRFLLVGGSSKMPQVSRMIETNYGMKPVLMDPDEAVAKGAAIFASNQKDYNDFIDVIAEETGKSKVELQEENLMTGELDQRFLLRKGNSEEGTERISITNVLSRTYGVAALDEKMREKIYNLLKINDALPAQNTDTFFTLSNGQKSIDIKIFETRSKTDTVEIEDKKPITTVQMLFVKSVPKNTPVKMTLALDNSGILHIIAEEQKYFSRLDTTFQLSNQMSEEDLSKAAKRIGSASVE